MFCCTLGHLRLATRRNIKFVRRLGLDEALEQLENGTDVEKMYEGWSQARIRSYQQIETQPNAYFYRFNAPGEKQQNGPWTDHERELFFRRLAEVGAEGQWGVFAIAIPGRVGYQVGEYRHLAESILIHLQCSNYYRHLIKSGEIKDDNYVMDEKGELRYLFGKKAGGSGEIRTHIKTSFLVNQGKAPPISLKRSVPVEMTKCTAVKPKPPVKRQRKAKRTSDSESEDDDAYSADFSYDQEATVYISRPFIVVVRMTAHEIL
jgi:hypothetical protein